MFCQLLLQLVPEFNIQALEALITLKVVDLAITEVKDKVATGLEEATNGGVASEEAT